MPPANLSPAQVDVVRAPLDLKIFLEGPAGCGKTTAAVERLLFLMSQGVPGSSILLLVPQRTLADPYFQALNTPGVVAGGVVTVLTVGGLARRMVELFWPVVAEAAGFAHPDRPPLFLTLETAQYYMAHLVSPLLDEGYFESVTIDRNRLYSQIIDNLNKAAVVGFPHTEISERLVSAWAGEPGQRRVYQDAGDCAVRFRRYCREHNLLDFSLQMEVFRDYLWSAPACREYLLGAYRYMIVDNIEEDTPLAHGLVRDWLPQAGSALLVYDHSAGYRRFLGADPSGAYALRDLCVQRVVFDRSFVTSPQVRSLSYHLARTFAVPGGASPLSQVEGDSLAEAESAAQDPSAALTYSYHRFYPQMLDWVAAQITSLVNEQGVPPGEIAVLAPYLSDALRFSLAFRLEAAGVPVRSHRPSRSLREEPAARCLLTLACLTHPSWGIHPARFDLAYTLVQAIQGMDLVRAQLLAEIVYRTREGVPVLSPFENIKPDVQERITYRFGELFEGLRLWLEECTQGPEVDLDHFLSRLFGEVLSQPGYGFHTSFSAGEVAANLVESIQKFRWSAGEALEQEGIPLGKEYILMVQQGVIAAQYVRSWQAVDEDAVQLAPAYTFLMSNRPVEIQFWLDVSSRGWFERLYQPLTHPYVLSRHWPAGKLWTDSEELEASLHGMQRLLSGLLRRCRSRVYLGLSELGEQGYEQRGPLLRALNRVLKGQS
jgi:hypothetical protein